MDHQIDQMADISDQRTNSRNDLSEDSPKKERERTDSSACPFVERSGPAKQAHRRKEQDTSRPQEKKGGRRRRETREEEKGGTRKNRKPPPRHPRHPKTLRQSLPDRAKTMRLDNRNNSTKWLQNKIRALSQKPSEHKP